MGWLRDLFGKKKEAEIEEVKCSFCGQKRDDLQRLEGGWICPSCARPLGGLAMLSADLSVGEVKELLRAEAEAAGAVTLEPSIEEITPPETRFTEAYQDFLEAGAAIGRSGMPEVPDDAEAPEEAPETPAE